MLSWRGLAIHKKGSRKSLWFNDLADPPRTSARLQRCGFGIKNKWTPIHARHLFEIARRSFAQGWLAPRSLDSERLFTWPIK